MTDRNAPPLYVSSDYQTIHNLAARIAALEAKNAKLERCLRVWVGNLYPMATPEQNAKRIAAIKRASS